jgi:hypothetical protein
MRPIDYAAWGAGGVAATYVASAASDKAKECRRGQGMDRSARNVEVRVDQIMRKLGALQKIIDKNHPQGMTEDEAQVFYMNRRTEFAELASELKVVKSLAEAGDAECEEVIQIAKERARHWRLTLFLADLCPIL